MDYKSFFLYCFSKSVQSKKKELMSHFMKEIGYFISDAVVIGICTERRITQDAEKASLMVRQQALMHHGCVLFPPLLSSRLSRYSIISRYSISSLPTVSSPRRPFFSPLQVLFFYSLPC